MLPEQQKMLGISVLTATRERIAWTFDNFPRLLLDSMPDKTRDHYENKIAVFLHWYAERGYKKNIPDEGPMTKDSPSWKRICKALLRNDYWCKGLSFSQNKPIAYQNYVKVMKKRREKWGIF
jgi:predicted phosphoadenosine phosphosulfate sulfurtransferase